MDPLDLNLTLAPPPSRPEELEENNVPEPDLTLSLGRPITVTPPPSPPSLSAVPTVEREEPLRVQLNTPEEVSPSSLPPPLSTAERNSLFARASPVLLPRAVKRNSLPPRLSHSPGSSSVVPSSSQEVISLGANSDHFTRATLGPTHVVSDPISTVERLKKPTPPLSPVESQKDCSAVVHTVESPPLLQLLSPRASSAAPNSAKEWTSLPASVDRCSSPRPSQITDTTDVKTVQKLSFPLSPMRIQNFDPGSSLRASDPRVLALCARNSPPSKVHYASISGHSEVPVPPPASVQGAADIRGWITETKDALLARGIRKISGDIKCNKCKKQSTIDFDLPENLSEMAAFIASNKAQMGSENCITPWYYPNWLNCPNCHAISSCRPVLEGSAHEISWLFLFLGKLLGFCTRDQLYSYLAPVLPEFKKRETKDVHLDAVFSHIIAVLDPGRSTEMLQSIPSARATP